MTYFNKIHYKILKWIFTHYILIGNILLFSLIVFYTSGIYILYQEGVITIWRATDWEKVSYATGDIENYVYMAEGKWEKAIAPYIFRPLIPGIVYLMTLMGIPATHGFLYLNAIQIFIICVLLFSFLRNEGFTVFWSRLGVIICSANFVIPDVAGWPNVDLGCLIFTLVILIGLQKDSIPLIILGFIGGVLVRESIIFMIPIVFFWYFPEIFKNTHNLKEKIKKLKKPVFYSIIATFSFLIPFLIVRGWQFNYNYDFNLVNGEFNYSYLKLTLRTPQIRLYYLILSMNIMWFGFIAYFYPPLKWKKDKLFYLGLYGILIMIAIMLLASHIIRIFLFLTPLYLAPFLNLLKEIDAKFKIFEKQNKNEKRNV